MAFFSGVAAAPLAEELLFRVVLLGWLDKAFNRRSWGWESDSHKRDEPYSDVETPSDQEAVKPAVLIPSPAAPIPNKSSEWVRWAMPNVTASLLFASLHMWPTQIPLFFLSLGFGWLFLRTRSWTACTVMHSVFNGINTCLLCVYIGLGLGPSEKPSGGKDPVKVGAPVKVEHIGED